MDGNAASNTDAIFGADASRSTDPTLCSDEGVLPHQLIGVTNTAFAGVGLDYAAQSLFQRNARMELGHIPAECRRVVNDVVCEDCRADVR